MRQYLDLGSEFSVAKDNVGGDTIGSLAENLQCCSRATVELFAVPEYPSLQLKNGPSTARQLHEPSRIKSTIP